MYKAGHQSDRDVSCDELKLVEGASGRLGTVSLRWTEPASGEAVELARELETADLAATFATTDAHFRLAATAAAFAEVLRESYWATQVTHQVVAAEATARAAEFPADDAVAELAEMASRAASLAGE